MAMIRRRLRQLRRRARGWLAAWRPGRVVAASERLWSVVPPGARLERVAGGFRFTEGPVWLPAERVLLFTDIPASRIYRWDGKRASVFRSPSDHANGLALDREGRLLMCEHGTRRLSRLDADGSVSALADAYRGRRLNSPNDVVVRRDGRIFFTDPPFGIRHGQQELPHQGIYCFDPYGGTLTLASDALDRPNGLAFSPDETRLYVTDSARRHVYVFDVDPASGRLANQRLFCDMQGPVAGNPDGLAVDGAGHLFCTGPGGVWVLDRSGRHLGTIAMREQPSNCTWGDADRNTLYVTAQTSLYRLRLRIHPHPGAAQDGA